MATQAEAIRWLQEREQAVNPANVRRAMDLMSQDQIAASGGNTQQQRLDATGNVDRLLGQFADRTAAVPPSGGSASPRGGTTPQSSGPSPRRDVQPTVAAPGDGRPLQTPGGRSAAPVAAGAPAVSSPAAAPRPAPTPDQQFDDGARLIQMLTGARISRVPGEAPPAAPAQMSNVEANITRSMPVDPDAEAVRNEAEMIRGAQEERAATAYTAAQEEQAARQFDQQLSPGEIALLQALGLGGAAGATGLAVRYARSPTPQLNVGAPPPPMTPRAPPMPNGAAPPIPQPPPQPVAPAPPSAPRSVINPIGPQGAITGNPAAPPQAGVVAGGQPPVPGNQRVGTPMPVSGGSAQPTVQGVLEGRAINVRKPPGTRGAGGRMQSSMPAPGQGVTTRAAGGAGTPSRAGAARGALSAPSLWDEINGRVTFR